MYELIFKCVVYADIIRYRSIAIHDYRHLPFLIVIIIFYLFINYYYRTAICGTMCCVLLIVVNCYRRFKLNIIFIFVLRQRTCMFLYIITVRFFMFSLRPLPFYCTIFLLTLSTVHVLFTITVIRLLIIIVIIFNNKN